jgi:hypothetical protein
MTAKKAAAPAQGAALSKTTTARKAAPKKTEAEAVPVEAIQESPAPKGVCIVIPYLDKSAAGDELRYAIRAWEKHLITKPTIVVIGDSKPWFGKDIRHIPHKAVSTNPQIDVADKLATAIASDLVDDLFIWTNDDIYPVGPVDYADLFVKKSTGRIVDKGAAGGVYAENANRTIKALQKAGISRIMDYATHTPVAFDKISLADTLAAFHCQKEGHLISTLYFNTHYPDARPIITSNDQRGSIVASVWSTNPNQQILADIWDTRKFVNHDDRGYKACLPYLQKLFGEKSSFEK